MSSTLALSSPLIGSWADQPVDDRQSALMAATQEAANARRAAAAAKAAAQNKATAAATAAAPANPAVASAASAASSSPAATAADGSTPASASSAAVAPVVYSATFIDPSAPMSAAFQAKQAALTSAADAAAAASSDGGAPGGWQQTGKLKEMARTVFERAYGLNGRQLADHESLCEEICWETHCSRKSFCELIYGHSYAAELTDLRALVEGYRPKEKRKRETSDRGRGLGPKNQTTAEQSDAATTGKAPANGHTAPAAAAAPSSAVRAPSPSSHSTVHLIPVPSSPSLRAHASHPAKLPLQGMTLLSTTPQDAHAASTQQQQQQQYTFNGQPIQQHPIIHLTHRLIPSAHSNQANAAMLNAVTQQPAMQFALAQQQQQQAAAAASAAHPVFVPLPNARFAPPSPSGPRRPSPGPSPLLKPRESPLSPTGPVGSAGPSAAAAPPGVLSPPGRRSIDASSAMRASVVAANSVSPHLQSLGDPTLNPALPMVPSSPSLQPIKGSELRNQQAKAVGSPLRQSMNAQMAAAVLQGGSANLPPRASPSLNPMRTPYAHPPVPPQPIAAAATAAAASKPAGFAPSVSPPPVAAAAVAPPAVAVAPMSFAAAVASKTPATTIITPKPSTQMQAAAPVAAAAAPSAAAMSAPAPVPSAVSASADLASKASGARSSRVRAQSATMRDEDGSLVPVSPVPEEAELPADSPKSAAVAASSSSSAAAAAVSSSDKKKKPSKKQRAKDKKRAEEAAAAAAAPAASSTPVAPAASSSEEESPSASSRSAKKKSASAAASSAAAAASAAVSSHPKPKRKFSATPPSSPPLYAMSHEAAALAVANGGASSSSRSVASCVGAPIVGAGASTSSAFLRLLLWLGAASVLFTVARSLLCTVLYGSTSDASGSASQSWSLIAALYVCSVFLFGWLFRCAHDANAGWAALVLELSNQLEKYVTVWELLAVDDPAQLLAAINQIQQLLDASLASFCGLSSCCGLLSRAHALSALDHAVQTMDFLHLAHRNLISELGSTQPIMRLVASLGTVRNKVMQIRSKMPEAPRPGQSDMDTRPLTLMLLALTGLNVLLLLLAPPLSTGLLNALLPLGLLLALVGLVMAVWSAQYPFAASPLVAAPVVAPSSSSFPACLISAALGHALLVSLEPLHYLRTRLGEREAETKQRMDDAQQSQSQAQTGQGTEASSPLSATAQHQLMHELEDELAEEE